MRELLIMQFEWDERKNTFKIKDRGLDFKDAKELFINNTLWKVEDNRSNYRETRFVGFGYANGRVMNVVYTKRLPNIIRIISFRKANTREKKYYEKNVKN